MKKVLVLLLVLLASGCSTGHPKTSFSDTPVPPTPEYSRSETWLAWPGRHGLERSVPKGVVPIDESAAPADVFFIHPTTYLKNDVWNVALDAPTAYGADVLLNQASVFNGCCRIYAPHYRQATLNALGNSRPAVELAYADVLRAFRWYIEHENHGRPFIIASHSQGTVHAVRLVQEAVLGTELQSKLIAVYAIGSYVPSDFGNIGLPACEQPAQTGCVLSWNTSERGRTGAYRLTRKGTYWWRGAWKSSDLPQALCVNPLTWRIAGGAPAALNSGSEALPKTNQREAQEAQTLPDLQIGLTGAICNPDLLEVHVGLTHWDYQGALSIFFGSYHLVDYGLFWDSMRRNASVRVAAWQQSSASAAGTP